ncbi:MAG: hypothetical protein QF464_15640 [Myxococcota bacterium]|nr:hypothetical protein [Myxococcota bacterium]
MVQGPSLNASTSEASGDGVESASGQNPNAADLDGDTNQGGEQHSAARPR